jgi:Holliday junction resolvase RusA-like endonuclease
MLLAFEVETMPVPQARARFFSRCRKCRRKYIRGACEECKKHTGAYDTDRSRTYKEVIAWHAKVAALKQGLGNPVDGPISIRLIFIMGKKGRVRVEVETLNDNGLYHKKRPDIDNLAKAVKDALKGIVYADDSQIAVAYLYKQINDLPEEGQK